MIKTNSVAAAATLASIETMQGHWYSYGLDGRSTVDAVDGAIDADEGKGFKARFIDNPLGGDYGWGPLGQTEAEAIALLLAESKALSEEDE